MAKARRDTIHDARDLPVFVVDDALIDRHGAQIGAYGVAVYTTLARYAKQGHATILAYQTIADALGIGRTTVRDTIKRLAEIDLIRVEPQTDDAGNPIASNRYTLLPIGDKKAETQPRGGAATRQGVPPHDTPLPPDDGGVPPADSPYRHTAGGVPPHVYMDHDPLLDRKIESPPPPVVGGGGDSIEQEPPNGKPNKTELYHWLRQNGVDSPAAAERNQHHDPDLTRAMFQRMVGDSNGDDRKKRIGRFIRALEADGPTPPRPAATLAPPAPAYVRPADALDPREAVARMAAMLPRKERT
jgi:DNA-binding MarR family transcriptional regulator